MMSLRILAQFDFPRARSLLFNGVASKSMPHSTSTATRISRLGLGVLFVAALGAGFWWSIQPPPLIVQGEVEAARVDLAPRVSGRIKELHVDVGDTAKAGAVVVVLDSPQLQASLVSAQAALEVARADRDRVYSTRPETIQAKRADVERAQSALTLAQQVYARQTQLLQSGNTPQQRVDEATNNLRAAQKARDAASAELSLVTKGASDEERILADARVKQSEAVLHQTETDVSELTIRAPITGQVTTRVAELGELFNPGSPLLSIVDLADIWLTFNIREDLLSGLKVGDVFEITVPALKGQAIKVRVTAINAQGQYANWRATKATGDFDLRTFEVRAKSVEPNNLLRPGMSSVARWAGATQRRPGT